MSRSFRHEAPLRLLLMAGLLVGNGVLFCGLPCCQDSPEPCHGERSVSGGAASSQETVGTGGPWERCCMSVSDERAVVDQQLASSLGSLAQPYAAPVARTVSPTARRAETGASRGASAAGTVRLAFLCTYLL